MDLVNMANRAETMNVIRRLNGENLYFSTWYEFAV